MGLYNDSDSDKKFKVLTNKERLQVVHSDTGDKIHEDICRYLTETYKKKNADYGNSFEQSWRQYGPTVGAIRIEDKLNRFKNYLKLIKENKVPELSVPEESVLDTMLDMANYCILSAMMLMNPQHKDEELYRFFPPDLGFNEDKEE